MPNKWKPHHWEMIRHHVRKSSDMKELDAKVLKINNILFDAMNEERMTNGEMLVCLEILSQSFKEDLAEKLDRSEEFIT